MAKIRWYFGFFLVSGFCSLLYEVVWMRLAMAQFGVTTPMNSIVLSTFMGGLGLGSWLAGAGAEKLKGNNTAKKALAFYAGVELLTAFSSLLVPPELKYGHSLLLPLGGAATWESWRYYILSGGWIAVTLLPWCACMGATFPLLMAVIRRQVDSGAARRSFSYLYTANVLGALCGTLVSAFLLVELLGFQGTLHIAGILNLLLGAAAFWLSRDVTATRQPPAAESRRETPVSLYGFGGAGILVLLFTTGLVSMALEVVWIRQYTPYLGNIVYAFAIILGVYLLATAGGSARYRTWAQKYKPEESRLRWAVLGLAAVLPLLAVDPRLPLGTLWAGPLLRVLLLIPFCATAGFLTPMLVDLWSGGAPERAGRAYAVNLLGSILGPLLAGFLLLPQLGERFSTAAIGLPLLGFGALLACRGAPESARTASNDRLYCCLAAGLAVLLVITTVDYEKILFPREVKRDYTATVVATGTSYADKRLYVNGLTVTHLTPLTKVMAHYPMALLPRKPKNALVICFGMGTSFRSLLTWNVPVTVVDLVPSVPAEFHYFHPDAEKLLRSPNAHVIADDGRRFLDGTDQTFDVITEDPPPPVPAAGTSLLYSREFYAIVRRHLNPGGIAQIWYMGSPDKAVNASVAAAIRESFPYVRAYQGLEGTGVHYIASASPIPDEPPAVLARRLPAAAARDFVEWGPGKTAREQFGLVVAHPVSIDDTIAAAPGVPALEDDQPINEYFLLRRLFGYYR